MYKDKKILCIIPARGGSKGLPGKNIRILSGKPLISYSIEQAKKNRYVDRVVVSTDDNMIAEVSKKYGAEVPFMRPSSLATDSVSTIDVLLHAVNCIESGGSLFDIILLLSPTAPLRNVQDIDDCIKLLVDSDSDNVFSVSNANRNPYFNMVEIDGIAVKLVKEGNFFTRQSAPNVFDINCSIYLWKKDVLMKNKSLFLEKTRIYVMPRERSIDIDDSLDFKIVEMLLDEEKQK